MNNDIYITTAIEEKDFDASIILFKEYAAWLHIDLCFQNFEEELKNLKEMYAPPYGIILLAKNDDEYVGCVAVRKKSDGIAELKRMYVKPIARNKGIAQKLLIDAIKFASEVGYEKIRLDTLSSMHTAINLYKREGFYEIEPYYFNPETNALFFEKLLTDVE
jgi:putative acetyltransferase